MKFDQPLVRGRLLRRYKRFLADVWLDTGVQVTAHTANTGAMTGCAEPGSRVWLSIANKAGRKYPYTWELVETGTGALIGINTLRANALVEEAITGKMLPSLNGYETLQREQRYGDEASRIDLKLSSRIRPDCYIEVKNVTLVRGQTGYFPDAVSMRGQKHLRELIKVVQAGDRAVLCFCVQRDDVTRVGAADWVDADYAEGLKRARKEGVEIMAVVAPPRLNAIAVTGVLPVRLDRESSRCG
ncbi:MAG: DNA/RNA nuclease SfsA [Gammaproteobacteria bacterium]|nr:DNA/RNA nuclease SfsA [Gammaproteobacteria bacterium]